MPRRAPPTPLNLSGQAAAISGRRSDKYAPPTIPEPLALPPSPRTKLNHHTQPSFPTSFHFPSKSNSVSSISHRTEDRPLIRAGAGRLGRPRLNVDIPLTPSPYLSGPHSSSTSSSSSSVFSPNSALGYRGSGSTSTPAGGARGKKKLPPWLSSSSRFDAERETIGFGMLEEVVKRPCEAGSVDRGRVR